MPLEPRTGIPGAVAATNYDAANRQLTFGDKTLTYDNNGNLTSILDANGTTLYTWNARNQLTGISGPSVNASFMYDAVGRREKKTINGSLAEFLYDGFNPVQETSGATVLANVLTGIGIDEFFTRTELPTATASHFLPDALGSAVALGDSAGTVQTEYTFEPFGGSTATGGANSNPFQYTGRENDGIGVYYYRARYYHPQFQRFTSEDPIESYSGGMNLYAFVGDKPTKFVDPMGLQEILLGGRVFDTISRFFRTTPPPENWPLPPGWNEGRQWRYPETINPRTPPRWFDPQGGEWRWSPPGESAKWHPEFPKGHWDYNPWDQWNSPWRNVPPNEGIIPPLPGGSGAPSSGGRKDPWAGCFESGQCI